MLLLKSQPHMPAIIDWDIHTHTNIQRFQPINGLNTEKQYKKT